MTDIHGFVDMVFGENRHVKRIPSLSHAASGVIARGSLAIHAIGAGLALANEIQRKHAIKRVDRLLSNPVLNLPAFFRD